MLQSVLFAALAVMNVPEPIHSSFSLNSHNRISVDGGAVDKIFGDSSIFSVTIDATTGQAFINVLKEIDELGALLTVITTSGFTQDIEVASHEGTAAYILLKEPEEEVIKTSYTVSHAPTIEMLNKILDGKIPFGYGERPLMERDVLALPSPLIIHQLKAFDGPFETIVFHEIENEGEDVIVLSPDALKKGNAWVFLESRELHSKQKTVCIAGRERE